MDSYSPPFSITPRMLLLISSISEKIGEIAFAKALDAKPHLRKQNNIQSIHASLRIEANSLSLPEVEDIINGRFVIGDRREIQEVKNAYQAYELLDELDPYSLADLKRTHGIMTNLLEAESGIFRSGAEGVERNGVCIFIAPPAAMVPTLMGNLFKWMEENKETVHPLILAAVFHYEFVFIHPFSDGNGRMARLWHTLLLSKWRHLFSYIPLESQVEKFQEGYYRAIQKCHENGSSDEFILFMLERIEEILSSTAFSEVPSDEKVKKLLSVMVRHVPYTALSLMKKVKLKSRDSFYKNYLKPALQSGLIQRTIPEKPNSRNQRYRKV